MKRLCREMRTQNWDRRQLAVTALLRRAKVVTDPHKLEYLNAQVAKRKARTEAELLRTRRQPVAYANYIPAASSPVRPYVRAHDVD